MFVDKILASDAPSIALQRIVIVFIFAVAGAMVWWQHSNQNGNYLVQQFATTPLPDGVADLDISAAEAAWSELIIDSKGALEINAQTELALSEVIALMSDDAFDLQMDRMALLIEKQFGAAISAQFAGLLPILKNYKDIEQRWWETNGNTMPPAYSELFQLQDDVLGEELAGKLFSEQRRLANIMLAGHRIQSDAGLTQAQKDQALADLHGSFDVGGADE